MKRLAFAALVLVACQDGTEPEVGTRVGPRLSTIATPASAPSPPLAYVTNGNSGTVSVIETAGNTVVATVGVAAAGFLFGPYGVAITPSVKLTPEEQIQAILDEIVTLPDLNGDVAGALISKLENVIAKLDKDNVNAAINQLQAFINQIQALIQAGTLAQPDGEILIDVAQGVIDQLTA